jgi:uncharacterized membrane protein YsdA (DUF1294 family)
MLLRRTELLLEYHALASLATFCVYAFDKVAARQGRRRIRERTLHGLALLGGWPGALLAQRLLHHKSSKRRFQVRFWLTVLVHCSVLLFAAGLQ